MKYMCGWGDDDFIFYILVIFENNVFSYNF